MRGPASTEIARIYRLSDHGDRPCGFIALLSIYGRKANDLDAPPPMYRIPGVEALQLTGADLGGKDGCCRRSSRGGF
jgi:hypothetical protein